MGFFERKCSPFGSPPFAFTEIPDAVVVNNKAPMGFSRIKQHFGAKFIVHNGVPIYRVSITYVTCNLTYLLSVFLGKALTFLIFSSKMVASQPLSRRIRLRSVMRLEFIGLYHN